MAKPRVLLMPPTAHLLVRLPVRLLRVQTQRGQLVREDTNADQVA